MINNQLVEHHYYHSNINPEFVKQIDLAIEALNNACQSIDKEQEQPLKQALYIGNFSAEVIPEGSVKIININNVSFNVVRGRIFKKIFVKKDIAGSESFEILLHSLLSTHSEDKIKYVE